MLYARRILSLLRTLMVPIFQPSVQPSLFRVWLPVWFMLFAHGLWLSLATNGIYLWTLHELLPLMSLGLWILYGVCRYYYPYPHLLWTLLPLTCVSFYYGTPIAWQALSHFTYFHILLASWSLDAILLTGLHVIALWYQHRAVYQAEPSSFLPNLRTLRMGLLPLLWCSSFLLNVTLLLAFMGHAGHLSLEKTLSAALAWLCIHLVLATHYIRGASVPLMLRALLLACFLITLSYFLSLGLPLHD